MLKTLTTTAALALMAGAAHAAPVDLSSWLAESAGSANWVRAADNNSVRQTVNGAPTIFHNNQASQGNDLRGTITVGNTGDDDFIGFVLGYQAGDMAAGATGQDYILIDWKKGTQTHLGTGQLGLAASRVTSRLIDGNGAWAHDFAAGVTELARGTSLGSTGWVTGQTYAFTLTFTNSLIEVFVDGSKEISLSGSFSDGAFGFYNYSQDNVTYAGIQTQVLPPAPVPLPAGAVLMLTGLGGIGALRLRRKRG